MAIQEKSKTRFIITRSFNAPIQMVWKALTEVPYLQNWWGTRSSSWVTGSVELRPGGEFKYCLRSGGGLARKGKWVYEEIAAPNWMAFTRFNSNLDEELSLHPVSENWPNELKCEVKLTESNGGTTLVWASSPINASEKQINEFESSHDSMLEGFTALFNKLESFLESLIEKEHASQG